ncbi:MAG: undecaprenyldiphospho-muramoylpentapeptide beta-N-acetylglucosaminyltransferase [Acidiferrobacterales bacterium]
MSKVMIVAGGTGGHVFPGLAVAECLRSQGVDVVWVGTRSGLEARAVPTAGFAREWISIRGVRRRGVFAWLLLPMKLAVAIAQTLRIMWRHHPDVVLAMGGFVAGPGGLGAWLLRKPLLIHEQNAIPGFTNRWLALLADEVLCGFPGAFRNVPRAQHVGNPVRKDIATLPSTQGTRAQNGSLCLLVLGGTQGAQVLNTVVPEALRAWKAGEDAEVWHQCGRNWLEPTRAAYATISVPARVTAFIDDMATAYRWADLVICRAGAMTVAELCAAGRAAILVPYPHAVDGHQTANAEFLAKREAAVLLPQEKFVATRVRELIEGFSRHRELLATIAFNARRCAMPDAAETISQLCLEAMHA